MDSRLQTAEMANRTRASDMEIQAFASGSTGNLYRVTDGVTPLLLEAGLPWKQLQRALGFKVSDLAGCLVSHEHGDHSRAVKDLMRAGVDCHMTAGTAETLGVTGHRVKIIRAREQFILGTWTVLPFEAEHDAQEPVGFLAAAGGEKLLYLTDSFYCRYRFQGLTHVMVECNYAADILRENMEAGAVDQVQVKRIIRSHFSLEHVKEFLQANDLARVREIWLIHLSAGNSDAERFKREIQALTGKPVYVA